ncbi:MAG TPA: aldo/keto reductase [Chthoniobacterales bacterium]|nr:aldo/keto reductase [Chthoniobacterales bacterium]
MKNTMTRREATRLLAGTAASLLAVPSLPAQTKASLLQRAIPSSGEMLPVIGLGTSGVFNASSATEREPLEQVVATLVKLGGKMIDTAPAYGQAETVTGEIAAKLKLHDKLFLATKVGTTGQADGVQQMEHSLELLGKKPLDLIQVHNLTDWEVQLANLTEWKKQGRIRYTGITSSRISAHADIVHALEKARVDFVQINYSLMERQAEERILPLAKERGVAVIVNRPFGRGDLFGRVQGKPLPEWAPEIDCKSWAQLFLKWIVAHPAVTCIIPATSKSHHMEDNMGGGMGRMPDEKMRRRMVEAMSAL